MKKLALLSVILLMFTLIILPTNTSAHENTYELHPLSGEYTVSVATTELGNNSWVFEYTITNINQQGDWSGITTNGLPPEYMNGIDFTGLTNFFVKVPHGVIVSNVNLPPSYGASHGVNPEYIHEWHMQGPWQENPYDVYDWIMIYPYGFAEIYPKGNTLVFSFQIDEVAVGVNEGRISTYYPDHVSRYPGTDNYSKWYDCYTFQMTSPVLLPEQQIDNIQEFYDDAVSTGNLVGEGRGSSKEGRIKAFSNMLQKAKDFIDQGLITEAVSQLEDIYKKVDGNSKPPDFVSGQEAQDFSEMILDLINTLRSQ